MSTSARIARAKDRIDPRRPASGSVLGEWIGIDLSGEERQRRTHWLLPLLLVALIAALGVSSLRIDLIRVRYAMATALDEEKALIAEQRRLIVRRRQLRDPTELAIRARSLGFRPATRIISMPEPIVPGTTLDIVVVNLPAVAARPPKSEVGADWQ